MKKYILILTAIVLTACDKSDEMEQRYNLDALVELSIMNPQGEDILDPEHPSHINKDDIKLFYVISGKTEEVYDENLEYPRHFLIFKHENEYRVRVFPNYSETEEKPVTYVQWNEEDRDTISITYERTPNAVMQRKIWFNGELIWDWKENKDPFFVLTK